MEVGIAWRYYHGIHTLQDALQHSHVWFLGFQAFGFFIASPVVRLKKKTHHQSLNKEIKRTEGGTVFQGSRLFGRICESRFLFPG